MRRVSRLALFVAACAIVAAIVAVAGAPRSILPAIALARVEVFADAPGLPSDEVVRRVGRPLAAALAAVPQLVVTRSYADPEVYELELDFAPSSSADDDLRNVQAILAQVRDRIPASHLTALIEGPGMEPVVTYALTSSTTRTAEVRRRVEAAIGPVFVGTPGLARVTVFAGTQDRFTVTLDPAHVSAAGITARRVADAIGDADREHLAGGVDLAHERIAVVTGTPLHGPADIAHVRVARTSGGTVPLSSLGATTRGDEPTDRDASFDAQPAVIVNVYATANGDAVAVKNAADARMDRLRSLLPPGIRTTIAWDQTRLIDASAGALGREMLIGAIVALACILWLLRDRALVLVAGATLVTAASVTVLIVLRSGASINLMTLGGLAIAVGLIVDEVIVVIESVATVRERDDVAPDQQSAVDEGVRRVAKPLIAATAANVVVFFPLSLLTGIPGAFFRALSLTLIVALLVSIALSLGFAPLLAKLLRADAPRKPAPIVGEALYARLLRRAFAQRAWVLAGAAILAVASFVVLARVPNDFLPSLEEGQFEIKYALPPGTATPEVRTTFADMERTIGADPAVLHEARLSGVDTNGYVATPRDAGTIRVIMRPGADAFDTVAERLRTTIQRAHPEIALEVHQLLEDEINDLSGAPEPIQLTVRGASPKRLGKIAASLADAISDLRGVDDTYDGVAWQARVVHASSALGASPGAADFADAAQGQFGGFLATTIDAGGPVPVVVRTASHGRPDASLALGRPALVAGVQEEDGAPIVRVTAQIENDDLSSTMARVTHAIARQIAHLPSGYHIDVGGAIVAQRAAFREFGSILALALLLVFGVLLATFNSVRLSLIVLAAVPLAPIGVAAALAVTHTPLNVASFMGMLLLVGFVVRNGILLVERANARLDDGATRTDAMERSARERLRPILMTAVATLAALAPLALGFGAGAELERPLAVAVIGGIVAATALTLIVIPVLYIGLGGEGHRVVARRSEA